MEGTTPRIPEALSTDSSDVSDALDVAQSLWENGKKVDAIHWVKRAAESAKAGDPTRLATLTRAAADLERVMSMPPPAPAPPPVVSRPPPPPVPKVSRPPPPVPAAARASKPPPPAPVPTPQAPSVSTSTSVPIGVPRSSPSDQTLRVRATMRVSVKASVRDDSLYVVRPLADGAAIPPGTREALLTFVADENES